MSDHIADLLRLVDAGGAPVVLAGSSWGATLGLQFALEYPDRVVAVVISGYVGGYERDSPGASRTTTLGGAWSMMDPVRLDTWRPPRLRLPPEDQWPSAATDTVAVVDSHPTEPPESRFLSSADSLEENVRKRIAEPCASTMTATLSDMSSWARAPRLSVLSVPVLAIHGDQPTRHADGTEQLRGVIPDLEIELIPGAGHDPWFTHPHAFFARVDEFLSGH